MRLLRALTALALLTLAAPAAHAAPPTGEIVFVGTGAVMGTLTVKSKVTLDFSDLKVSHGGAYTMLAVIGKSHIDPAAMITTFPGLTWPSVNWPGDLAPGRYSVRMLTGGATTMTVRAYGMRGRMVVRLRQPLPGATAKLQNVSVLGDAVVRDDLPLSVPRGAIVVHGFIGQPQLMSAWNICMRNATVPCLDDVRYADPREIHEGVERQIRWPYEGAGAMTSQIDVAGTFTEPVTHFALVLPLG